MHFIILPCVTVTLQFECFEIKIDFKIKILVAILRFTGKNLVKVVRMKHGLLLLGLSFLECMRKQEQKIIINVSNLFRWYINIKNILKRCKCNNLTRLKKNFLSMLNVKIKVQKTFLISLISTRELF